MTARVITCSLTVLTALACTAMADDVSLSENLMPLFARSCTGCHQREGGNQKAIENGPYLEKKSDIMNLSGTLIIPGKPENSYLLMIMSKPKPGIPQAKTMPPKRSEAPRMSDEELKKISDWIKAGAKDN
jgi:mono/diheme cytochrome c family protein